jgi:cell division protein FtsN
MKKKYTYWIVSGILITGIFYLYLSQSSKNIKQQYNDTKQLCKNLSENHPETKDLYEECLIEATEIYEKSHPASQDDRDPYEDAQPGAYGPE